MCTPELVAEHVADSAHSGNVRVLLGPASELGRAATLRRDDLGTEVLRRWLDLVGPDQLVVEVVSHRLPGSGPGSSPHAARMAGLARRGGRRGWGPAGVTTVLSNAVRFADRLDAPTVDVLDAARRLVPMDVRHLDRSNAEGFLKSGKQMHEVAEEICRYAGLGEHGSRGATELLAATRTVADQCVLDPREDLGIGEVHFPEFEVSSVALSRGGAPGVPRPRGGHGAPGPPGRPWMGLAPRSEERAKGWLGAPESSGAPGPSPHGAPPSPHGAPPPMPSSAPVAKGRSGGATETAHGSGSGSGSATSSR